MSIQKSIIYTPMDITGKSLNFTQELKLNVLDKSGNYILYQDLMRHYNSQHQRTRSTKTRSEVRGGGRKPWRQKGTGRARSGSIRSPLWKGGGVIFGPKPNKKSLKLTKKERRLALQTLLYNKKKSTVIVTNLENKFLIPKTKEFLKICNKWGIEYEKQLLIVVLEKTTPLKLSIRNLKNVELILASNLNTFSLLKAKQIIITTSALKNIKEIYCE